MLELLESITETAGPEMRTRVIQVRRQNHLQIRELVRPPQSPSMRSPNDHGRLPRDGNVRPVSFSPTEGRWQEDEEGGEGNQADANPVRQFEDVQIDTMPDLDIIILRGRDQDLNQLEEIIRQIERVSRETRPEIRIYPLRNAASDAVAGIISETREDLIGGRQGKVSVTPLIKPNALLLIGWGDAVNAILELARKLDVPVDAATQFRVFRIRHAGAADISTSITSFFGNRDGLGPRVTVAVDDRTNSLIVYASPRDLAEVARLVTQLDVPGGQAVNRTKIIAIRNSLAADIAQTLEAAISAAASNDRSAIMELHSFDERGQQILRSGSLDDVQITPNLRNNTLILSSPRENLDLIEELIRQLDTPPARSQLKIFKVENSDASNLVQTLRSLIPASVQAAANLKLPTAPDEISLAPLRLAIDTRSNSILATGSEGDLRIVEALVATLDQSTLSQRKSEVYQLKNSPAVDVANAVNQFLQSSRQLESASPGARNPFQELEQEVVVVPEPIANKLLLSATPRYFEEISQLIEKLDEQPAQVVIQVLIAEVALNSTDEFGIELGLQDSVLFDRSLLSDLLTTTESTALSTPAGVVTTIEEIIQAATNTPGFNFNNTQPLGNSGSNQALNSAGLVGGQGVSNFAVGRGNNQLGYGGFVLSASSQNVSVLLRALQECRRIDVLSRPQIRTLDNQPAFIQVGQRVPRISGSTLNQFGQSNSVTLENVGLILGVTPRIGPDGTVVMEIDAEKSKLGEEAEGIPVAVSADGTVIRSPRVDTTTAQATVSAANGETIILGGLITNDSVKIHRTVPVLGDIPILKNFFKYDGAMTRRTELLIILTPQVIRTPEDNALIRDLEMARMNWCAADVFELHGDTSVMNAVVPEQLDPGAWDADEPAVIYPVDNPRGNPAPVPPRPLDPPSDPENR